MTRRLPPRVGPLRGRREESTKEDGVPTEIRNGLNRDYTFRRQRALLARSGNVISSAWADHLLACTSRRVAPAAGVERGSPGARSRKSRSSPAPQAAERPRRKSATQPPRAGKLAR